MSDRLKGVTVYFKKPMRDDAAQPIIDAISLLPNVSKIESHVCSHEFYFAAEQARVELRDKIVEILWPQRESEK